MQIERSEEGKRRLVLRLGCGRCLLGAVALLSIVSLVVATVVLQVGHFLTVDDPLDKADAIVVLATGPNRTRRAVELFEQGYAPVVVFSDATLYNMGLACSSAQMSFEDAQDLGLPASAVVFTDKATSTYEEAVNVRRLSQDRGWHSLIVVTDAFHTRRAVHTFRAVLPDVTIYASVAPDARYDPDRWWASEDSFVGVFLEVFKLGFYWIEYGVPPFAIGD